MKRGLQASTQPTRPMFCRSTRTTACARIAIACGDRSKWRGLCLSDDEHFGASNAQISNLP
jgi:hypothetical protein